MTGQADETKMTILNLQDIGLILAEPLFSNLNLSVAPGDRIGLVAANGRGKSSLLRLMAGTAEPTAGTITRARGLKVALVEQDPPAAVSGQTLRHAVLAA